MLLEQPGDGEGEEGRHERRAALEDVAAVEDRADDRGVGGRAADPALLECLDEARLGVARGRRGRVAFGLELERLQLVSRLQVRERTLLLLLGVVVAALLVGGEEAAERDHRARGGELGVAPVRRRRAEPQRDGLPARIGHLRGERPLPDQVVEGELVPVQLALELLRRPEGVAGGPDRLVRLLRVLDLAGVLARRVRNRVRAVELDGLAAGGGQRGLRQRRRVGAHVGDVAVLVEALGDPHRRLRRVAELAARLLLERRRHEGSSRPARVGLLVGGADGERQPFELRRQLARRGLVEPGEVVRPELALLGEVASLRHALAVDGGEPGFERAGVEDAVDVPVAGADEGAALAFALDHEAHRYRLDAAGGEALHDLLPEHRRDLVAVEPVEDPPRLLRVDQPLVDVAGLAERALDRVARDLVEDHPAHRAPSASAPGADARRSPRPRGPRPSRAAARPRP